MGIPRRALAPPYRAPSATARPNCRHWARLDLGALLDEGCAGACLACHQSAQMAGHF